MNYWFFASGDERKGPLSQTDAVAAIQAGQITADTLVWAKGMEQWAPASQTELGASFWGPPPLPRSAAPASAPTAIPPLAIQAIAPPVSTPAIPLHVPITEPQAAKTKCKQPPFYSSNGRVDRIGFLARWFAFMLIVGAASLTGDFGVVIIIIAIALIIINVVKRLHDMNKSGAYVVVWALLMFVPLLNFYLLLRLMLTPGDKGSNQYGPAP